MTVIDPEDVALALTADDYYHYKNWEAPVPEPADMPLYTSECGLLRDMTRDPPFGTTWTCRLCQRARAEKDAR